MVLACVEPGRRAATGVRCLLSYLLWWQGGEEGLWSGGPRRTRHRQESPYGWALGDTPAGAGILSACTVVPTGPHALVFPAVGKAMDVFQGEEGECRA